MSQEEQQAAVRAIVSGRVQGVGFRDFVARRAGFLRLDGYVRNLPDGAVEVYAEGPHSDLEQLLQYLEEGRRGADVRGVESDWLEPLGSYSGFGIAV
jgi:acylphosphatase